MLTQTQGTASPRLIGFRDILIQIELDAQMMNRAFKVGSSQTGLDPVQIVESGRQPLQDRCGIVADRKRRPAGLFFA